MSDLLRHSIPRSVWYGWGDPTEAHPLNATTLKALRDTIGIDPAATRARVVIDDVRLEPSRLDATEPGRAARVSLTEVVGDEHVHTDRRWRVEHAGGKSYPDIRRLREGDAANAPDGVVVPGSAEEVAAVLAVAVEQRIAVIPFGGGTSVVGGVGAAEGTLRSSEDADSEPTYTATIAVDLRRLNRLLHVDPHTRTATFEPGLRGPEIEQALHPYGLTLGHYPQSHQEATLGGYVATRSAGQASTGYGRIDDNVIGARIATPVGELVVGGRSPASAAGPRLVDLVVGSEGSLGIITQATLQVAPAPTVTRHATWFFDSLAAGAEALRHLSQEVGHGVMPDVCRLSDVEETQVNLTLAGQVGKRLLQYMAMRGADAPTLLILQFEGTDEAVVKHRMKATAATLAGSGGRRLPAQVARSWEKGRFSAPYLRDTLMDHAVLTETLETATTWGNLEALHDAVGTAIRGAAEGDGRRAIVMCHISHVYTTGASLYFTFVTPEGPDALEQWRAIKSAANAAIIAGGGTITHHHAVGTDHRAPLAEEIGEVGVRVLRAVKAELDPTGILNPGKLIP